MRYTVKNSSHRHIEVFNENDDLAGAIDYAAWRPTKAEITLPNDVKYQTAATGFWQTTIAITRDGLSFAEIKPDWSFGLRITLPDHAQPFIFKKKSFWSSDYILVDVEGNEIALVKVDFKWSGWGFDYQAEVYPNMLDKELNMILPVLMIYCAGYTRTRYAAAT